MAAHKGPASLRPRCTWSGSSIAAIPVYLPMKIEQTQRSEALAYTLQTLVNNPEERIQLQRYVKLVLIQWCTEGASGGFKPTPPEILKFSQSSAEFPVPLKINL
jgi:hypothetical protein